MFYKYLTDAA
jgi:hypothetical protein